MRFTTGQEDDARTTETAVQQALDAAQAAFSDVDPAALFEACQRLTLAGWEWSAALNRLAEMNGEVGDDGEPF